MKVIKSDARYQLYDRGFRIILEFNMARNNEREYYWAIRRKLSELYGPSVTYESNGTLVAGKWIYNTEWRYLQKGRRGRARLFIKDETIVSYLLLVEPVNTV